MMKWIDPTDAPTPSTPGEWLGADVVDAALSVASLAVLAGLTAIGFIH